MINTSWLIQAHRIVDIELKKSLENKTLVDKSAVILRCWKSLGKDYVCFKFFTDLSVFDSAYLCGKIFSHKKTVLYPLQSHLTSEHSEKYVKLKVTKYVTDIEKLAKTMEDQSLY